MTGGDRPDPCVQKHYTRDDSKREGCLQLPTIGAYGRNPENMYGRDKMRLTWPVVIALTSERPEGTKRMQALEKNFQGSKIVLSP